MIDQVNDSLYSVYEPVAGKRYSGADFWIKLKMSAKVAGRELVEKSLWLHYATRRSDTSVWAKTVAYTALAYFILPIDAIPDFIPLTGYTDDLAAIATAVATITNFIGDDVKALASSRLNGWFH